MHRPTRRLPIARRLRALLVHAPALAVALAASACNSDDTPLGPDADPVASGGEISPADAASGEASGPVAALITASERIAFISYRDPGLGNFVNGNVYKIDPMGNNEVRVTSSPDNDYGPSWSWDNNRIAMVRGRPDGTVIRADIWVSDADGGNGHWVRPSPAPWDLFDPTWSPDGSHLIVALWLQPYWYLARMNLATGDVHLLSPGTGGIIGTRPSYDRTGQKIVYVGKTYKTIEQVNADGTGHRTRVSALVQVDYPTFSPDGKKLAYQKSSGGNHEIWVKDFSAGTNKRLTYNPAADTHASWSPDGTRIAFDSERSGKSQIYTMNAATGGNVLRITHTSGHERYPSWSH